MRLSGATIDMALLGKVKAAPARQRRILQDHETNDRGEPLPRTRKRWYSGPAYVGQEVLAETLIEYPSCRCEELGLEVDLHVDSLASLGSGCTGSDSPFTTKDQRGFPISPVYVCPRLDKVRRRYGR